MDTPPGTHPDIGTPPPGTSASDWAIHAANVQKYGPLPLPEKYRYSVAAGRRIGYYPPGTFPIAPKQPAA